MGPRASKLTDQLPDQVPDQIPDQAPDKLTDKATDKLIGEKMSKSDTHFGLETKWMYADNLTPKPEKGDIIRFNRKNIYDHFGISDGDDGVYHFGVDPADPKAAPDNPANPPNPGDPEATIGDPVKDSEPSDPEPAPGDKAKDSDPADPEATPDDPAKDSDSADHEVIQEEDPAEASPGEAPTGGNVKFRAIWRYDKLVDVAHGSEVCIDNSGDKKTTPFTREEIIRRCEKALGDFGGTYNAASNNCEHKANIMRYEKGVSKQAVIAGAAVGGGILAGILSDPCNCCNCKSPQEEAYTGTRPAL